MLPPTIPATGTDRHNLTTSVRTIATKTRSERVANSQRTRSQLAANAQRTRSQRAAGSFEIWRQTTYLDTPSNTGWRQIQNFRLRVGYAFAARSLRVGCAFAASWLRVRCELATRSLRLCSNCSNARSTMDPPRSQLYGNSTAPLSVVSSELMKIFCRCDTYSLETHMYEKTFRFVKCCRNHP
jgi:hypothetical protein